jgi:hypothetical protein
MFELLTADPEAEPATKTVKPPVQIASFEC